MDEKKFQRLRLEYDYTSSFVFPMFLMGASTIVATFAVNNIYTASRLAGLGIAILFLTYLLAKNMETKYKELKKCLEEK